MPHLKVGMSQRLFAADAFGRVKTQQLREEIDCIGVGLREKSSKWNPRLDRQGTNVVLGLGDTQ